MSSPRRAASCPRYRTMFPDWSGPRPLSWFFMENLLEARAASVFPTNGCGPDEEVNVYLAQLLTRFLTGQVDHRVLPGEGARMLPPDCRLSRRERAEWYRANGDHRLLSLGLADRGDTCRRRRTPCGQSKAETRRIDLETGRFCFESAANLLEGRSGALSGLAPVLRRLANHFEDYVQVVAALATRRLGLGAVLSETDLAGLLREPESAEPTPAAMDQLLDLVNDHRQGGSSAVKGRILDLAAGLGVDPGQLGLEQADR